MMILRKVVNWSLFNKACVYLEDTCSNVSLVGRRRGQKDDDTQKEGTCSNISLVGRRRGQKDADTQKGA
jgi:hypothetical protein